MDFFSAPRTALRFKWKKNHNWHGDLIIANMPKNEICTSEMNNKLENYFPKPEHTPPAPDLNM